MYSAAPLHFHKASQSALQLNSGKRCPPVHPPTACLAPTRQQRAWHRRSGTEDRAGMAPKKWKEFALMSTKATEWRLVTGESKPIWMIGRIFKLFFLLVRGVFRWSDRENY